MDLNNFMCAIGKCVVSSSVCPIYWQNGAG